MKITTCYTAAIKHQLYADKSNGSAVFKSRAVDSRLMERSADICLSALRFCADVFLKEWKALGSLSPIMQKRAADLMIHSTRDNTARYPVFDKTFVNFPAYTRRAVIADALGKVRAYSSAMEKWQDLAPTEQKNRPVLGLPDRYALTFYAQDRKLDCLKDGRIGLKLYNGHTWNWYYFQISRSDAGYISALCKTRKLLSPVVEKKHGRYCVRFSFEETKTLVQDKDRLSYTVLAVDLGINAAASWCIMTSDGTVHAKGVIRLAREEDRLKHLINRKRKYQKAGKTACRCMYRWITNANKQLSIKTTKAIMDVAVHYKADCIVFEHLDRKGKTSGKKFRERIHLWRKNDVQHRVELQAHRHGMRISRVCAWNTSRLAFDGSGPVDRHSVYQYKKGKKTCSFSVCTFRGGKVYNCDLSAAQNIGARFFLREYEKSGAEGFPPTPQRTLCTLRTFYKSGCQVNGAA